MIPKIARAVPLLLLILLAAGCGSDTFLFPMRKEVSDLEIRSLANGQVLLPGDGLPIEIVTSDPQKNRSMDLVIAVFTTQGTKVWETRLTAAVTNEPLPPVQLPELAPGQYRLDLSLSSGGSEVQKKSAVFFSSKQKLRIAGIKSFPAGITVSSPVLIKAEIEAPAEADPYLRWSWRKKTIAGGFAGKGFKNILWSVPEEEGVYTITLEVFPTAPINVADMPYVSSLAMSTDIYVSAGKTLVPLELGPEGSYYALYHFRADLQESGAAEKKTVKTGAVPIGVPEIVPTDYGFGYRMYDGEGILIPWMVLPIGAGTKKPFTVSLSVRPEAEDKTRLLQIQNGDGSFSFTIDTDKESLSPELVISVSGSPDFAIPSNALMEKDKRHLLSVSIVPLSNGGFSVQWFLDGEQTAQAVSSQPFAQLNGDGKAIIGGSTAFKGTVDEFGVFVKDEKGRDSPDPSLYQREAERINGQALVLAEGFDGIALPTGFAVKGTAAPLAPVRGVLSLPPAAVLELPALRLGGAGIEAKIELGQGSAQEALFGLRYKGAEETFLETKIPARNGTLSFTLQDGQLTFGGPDEAQTLKLAAPNKPADLILTAANPKEAKAPLVVDHILVIKQKE